MRNELKPAFVSFFQETVRPVAVKCAKAYKTMVSLENGETIPVDNEDFIYIKTCVDPNAIWFIGLMIGDVDKAMYDGMRLNVINSVSQIHSCLNDVGYWKNIWNNDFSSDEAKNLKELASHMTELIKLM